MKQISGQEFPTVFEFSLKKKKKKNKQVNLERTIFSRIVYW